MLLQDTFAFIFLFFQFNFVYLRGLNSWGIHHNSNAFSNGGRRKIFGEFCPYGSSIAMCPRNLSPNHTEVGLFRFSGNRGLIFGPVNICAAFTDIPFSITFAFASFNFDKCGVFVLVSQTALETGKYGFGIQTSRLWCHFTTLENKVIFVNENNKTEKLFSSSRLREDWYSTAKLKQFKKGKNAFSAGFSYFSLLFELNRVKTHIFISALASIRV